MRLSLAKRKAWPKNGIQCGIELGSLLRLTAFGDKTSHTAKSKARVTATAAVTGESEREKAGILARNYL